MRCRSWRHLRFTHRRKSKIEYFDLPSSCDLDICRFQISMNDPALMSRLEPFGDLLRDAQGLIDRNRAAVQSVLQRFALDQLHHNAACVIGFFKTVNLCDVGMIQASEDLSLMPESHDTIRIVGEMIRQKLQRN